MAAYATPQRSKSGQLLHLEPAESASQTPTGVDHYALTIDAVFDQLVDRLAAAVAARLGGLGSTEQDDWLDSREAAAYLGLHRDTLRRLAAARAIPTEQDGPGCKLFFRRAALDEWRRSGGRIRHLAAVADAA